MNAEQLFVLLGIPSALQGGVRRAASEAVINSLPTHRVSKRTTDTASANKGTGADTDADAEANAKLRGDTDENDHGGGKAEKGGVGDMNTCNICLCDYETDEMVKTLPCGHCYHSPCIDRWLRNVANCPVCKQQVDGSRNVSG